MTRKKNTLRPPGPVPGVSTPGPQDPTIAASASAYEHIFSLASALTPDSPTTGDLIAILGGATKLAVETIRKQKGDKYTNKVKQYLSLLLELS